MCFPSGKTQTLFLDMCFLLELFFFSHLDYAFTILYLFPWHSSETCKQNFPFLCWNKIYWYLQVLTQHTGSCGPWTWTGQYPAASIWSVWCFVCISLVSNSESLNAAKLLMFTWGYSGFRIVEGNYWNSPPSIKPA